MAGADSFFLRRFFTVSARFVLEGFLLLLLPALPLFHSGE